MTCVEVNESEAKLHKCVCVSVCVSFSPGVSHV